MHRKIIVTTKDGRPDSLKEPIKIVFTLTPTSPHPPRLPYNHIPYKAMYFPVNGEKSIEFEWDTRFDFKVCQRLDNGTYNLTPASRVNSPEVLVSPDLNILTQNFNFRPPFQPGSKVKMTMSVTKTTNEAKKRYNRRYHEIEELNWSSPKPYGNDHSSIMVVNSTGSAQDVLLTVNSRNSVLYAPLLDHENITVPSTLALQGYIVDTAGNFPGNYILNEDDLADPLFYAALRCDVLPEVSTWRLCQDSDGVIQLENDEYPELVEQAMVDESEILESAINSAEKVKSRTITIYNSTSEGTKLLRKPTQIVLTVVPVKQPPFELFRWQKPIAWKILEFDPRSDNGWTVTWQPNIGFAVAAVNGANVVTTHTRVPVPIRTQVELKAKRNGRDWTAPKTLESLRDVIKVKNFTKRASFALNLLGSDSEYEPVVYYKTISRGGDATIGLPVMLQAYEVSGYSEGQLLARAHYQHNFVFSTSKGKRAKAIDLRTLKEETTFRLYSNTKGRAVLEKESATHPTQ